MAMLAYGFGAPISDPEADRGCPAWKPPARSFSFYSYAVATKTIHGIEYPRKGLEFFRGMGNTAQFDLPTVLRAIFDPRAHIGSKTHGQLRSALRSGDLGGIPDMVSAEIRGDFDILRKCYPSPSQEQANVLAAQLLDLYFERSGESKTTSRYIDYKAPDYSKTGDYGSELVFQSIYPAVANRYGYYILITREKTPRSMDLNYWNGNTWSWWGDGGEMIAPGYVRAGDVEGLQIGGLLVRRLTTDDGRTWAVYFKDLQNGCVTQKRDGVFHYCLAPEPKDPLDPQFRRVLDDTPAASILIGLCPKAGACPKPDASLMKYVPKWENRPDDSLLESVRNQVASIDLGENRLDVFTAAGVVAAPSPISRLTIESARWGELDYTKAAGDFCNTKATCAYQVSAKRLGLAAADAANPFTIRYRCSEDAARVREEVFPAPAEGKTEVLSCMP